MSNHETTGSRLDMLDAQIREYYIHTLTQQGITVSEKQCGQAMREWTDQNPYGGWVAYMAVHNNPFFPMKGKIKWLTAFMSVNSEETKEFLSQLIMLSKGYYDENVIKTGLIKTGLKSGLKVGLNTRRNRYGRTTFQQIDRMNKIKEAVDLAGIFYSATYIYLLNRHMQYRSQQYSIYEGLNAYIYWLNEMNEEFIGKFI